MDEAAPPNQDLHQRSIGQLADLADPSRPNGQDGGTDPAFAALLAEVLQEGIVELGIRLATSDDSRSAFGVVGSGSAVMAVGAPGVALDDHRSPREVTVVPTRALAFALTELLEVEARIPITDVAEIVLPRGAVDQLLCSDGDRAAMVVEDLIDRFDLEPEKRRALHGLAAGVRARWNVTASIALEEDRTAERYHDVIDGGDGGWWFVVADDDVEVVIPATGREVLAALESLLPTDDELLQLSGSASVAPEASSQHRAGDAHGSG